MPWKLVGESLSDAKVGNNTRVRISFLLHNNIFFNSWRCYSQTLDDAIHEKGAKHRRTAAKTSTTKVRWQSYQFLFIEHILNWIEWNTIGKSAERRIKSFRIMRMRLDLLSSFISPSNLLMGFFFRCAVPSMSVPKNPAIHISRQWGIHVIQYPTRPTAGNDDKVLCKVCIIHRVPATMPINAHQIQFLCIHAKNAYHKIARKWHDEKKTEWNKNEHWMKTKDGAQHRSNTEEMTQALG